MTNRVQRVRWEDPPTPTRAERKRRQPIWAERLGVLKTRPGVWGHVHTMKAAQAAVTNMRLGKVRGVDPLDYELTSRVVNGSGRVYAKYIGHLRTEGAMPPQGAEGFVEARPAETQAGQVNVNPSDGVAPMPSGNTARW